MARTEDAEAVTEVFLASRAVAMPYLPRVYSDEETRVWITQVVLPGSRVWVAELGSSDEVVGFAALHGARLEHLYLLPDARGRGIGALLLDVAKQASPEALTLRVFQRNTAARAFYERHGFEAIDFHDGGGNEENEPDVTYRWTAVR